MAEWGRASKLTASDREDSSDEQLPKPKQQPRVQEVFGSRPLNAEKKKQQQQQEPSAMQISPEQRREYRNQRAEEYARSCKEEIQLGLYAAELQRTRELLVFLQIAVSWNLKARETPSEAASQMVEDHLKFLIAAVDRVGEYRWANAWTARKTRSKTVFRMVEDHLNFLIAEIIGVENYQWDYARQPDYLSDGSRYYLGRMRGHAKHQIEEVEEKMRPDVNRWIEMREEMLANVNRWIERMEEMLANVNRWIEDVEEMIKKHMNKHEVTIARVTVTESVNPEYLCWIAAHLEISPAELHVLKMESQKMQPLSLHESEVMSTKNLSEESSDDRERQRLPDEFSKKDPREAHKQREPFSKKPETSLAEKSLVEVLEKQLRAHLTHKEKEMLAEMSLVEVVEEHVQFWKGSIRFLYEQLEAATKQFTMIRHKGSDILSYEGTLGGKKVHIKRYTNYNKGLLFLRDVRAFSMFRHGNIVQGLGWGHYGGDLFIVEELMDKGSLYKYIGSDAPSLPWDVRLKIVQDLASVILYMHEECCQVGVLHGDINSANVVLDSDYCAKLTSFRKLEFAYKDSDSFRRSLKTEHQVKMDDVYSFGIVLLEVATGRKADLSMTPPGRDLKRWVESLFFTSMDWISEVSDERLKGKFNKSEMEKLIVLGLWCTHEWSPSMWEVNQILEFGATLNPENLPFVWRTRQLSPASDEEAQHPQITDDNPQIDQVQPDDASLAEEIMDTTEKPRDEESPSPAGITLDENPIVADTAILAAEDIEIGIPEDYIFSGPMNNSQLQIMKSFIATLQAKILDGADRKQILEIIKTFTGTLAVMRAPIQHWKSLAQYVLCSLHKIEHCRETQEAEDNKIAISALWEALTKRLADELEADIQEQTSPSSSSSNLPKRTVESTEIEEAMEGVSLSDKSKIKVLDKTEMPQLEMMEYKAFANSILHKSLLSRISEFSDSLSKGE